MASFLSCPTELTETILKQVSFRDLATVSLVNKKLHKFATSHLYSQINFNIYRDNPRPIIHLTRTIFNKPELAKLIKSVRLRDGEESIQRMWEPGDWYGQYKVPLASPPHPAADDGLPEFVSFITESGLSYADIWIDKLQVGDLNAFVALLISKLPNLARFRVGYAVVLPFLGTRTSAKTKPRIVYNDAFLGKLFQSAVFDTSNHGLSRFKYLEEMFYPGPLESDPGPNPDFCNPQGLFAFLNLASMRSISGWCFNPKTLPFTWPSGLPDLANLTSLSLKYVHIDFLAQVLERTWNLKTLSWEWFYIPDYGDQFNTDTLDLDKFVEALIQVQETLEDLTIKFTNCMGTWDPDVQRINVLGSLNGLQRFTSIKRFWAPFQLLLPDWESDANWARRLEDSLPRNVEVVTVTDSVASADGYPYDEPDECAFLGRWLHETAATRTPHLSEVIVYMSDWSGFLKSYKSFDMVHQVFEGTNVKYRIIDEDKEVRLWEVV
ncbi:uncharacterized protein CC84DRAFT_1241026 [Paraphaeosphaeria sporulosa]|uniref:F-box domain-containing protein n=1 Tax=Paraphaeosphaeria sporulosa TaxID=1460663 RepID=A0A177CQU5_9PLEO|nr:uncharacterized protein CC84DRAFT_1241026 [Paraphaeosphaeria sporulosa]OAG09149.1 hypothetical protein CC84DRAFT_1241026 [Paraphaeosphaeria sporulosa]